MYLDPDPNHWLFIANLSVGVPTKKRNGILVGILIFYVSIKNLSRKMFAKCVGTNASNIGYAGFVYILYPCSGATLGTMVRVKKSSSVLHVPGR